MALQDIFSLVNATDDFSGPQTCCRCTSKENARLNGYRIEAGASSLTESMRNDYGSSLQAPSEGNMSWHSCAVWNCRRSNTQAHSDVRVGALCSTK